MVVGFHSHPFDVLVLHEFYVFAVRVKLQQIFATCSSLTVAGNKQHKNIFNLIINYNAKRKLLFVQEEGGS